MNMNLEGKLMNYMMIQINIIESEESGKVRCSLQPPRYIKDEEGNKLSSDEIEKTCKIVWIEIDNLLHNLQNIK